MKNLIFVCYSTLVLLSCRGETGKIPEVNAVVTDSSAIADAIHGFYQWYDAYLQDGTKTVDFAKVVGKHLTLDLPLLEKHLANIKASGFVSSELLDSDRAFYKACEKLWQNEDAEDVPSGMDADKYFCAQDWDIRFWVQSPVRLKSIGQDRVAATLYGTDEAGPTEQNFELKKENGKWLLTKIECDMGINETPSGE